MIPIKTTKQTWLQFLKALFTALIIAMGILSAALLPSRAYVGGWLYRRNETHIDLSHMNLHSVSGLKRMTQLEYVDLRGNDIGLQQLLDLKKRFPPCELHCEVPLEGQRIDNYTEALQMSVLREYVLPLFPQLKTLELQGVSLSAQEREELQARHPELTIHYTRAVVGDYYLPDTTKEIDLSGRRDFRLSELVRNLSAFPSLERITLTDCGFDNDSLATFRKGLSGVEVVWDVPLYGKSFLTTEKELDLSGQWIADLAPLEASLSYFPSLETLIMCNCGVSDADMDELCKRYPHLTILWEVHFGVFHLRTDVTSFLALAWEDGYTWLNNEQLVPLSYCKSLEALDLGHMWFSDTTFLSNMSNLRWLILSDNRIKDLSPLANLTELSYLELFLCDVEDISPLLSCPQLKHLNLSYCPVKNIRLLSQMPQLERVWLVGCNYDYDTIQYLRSALPNTQIMTAGESSTGMGWRKHPAYYEMRDAFGAPYMD